jgi:hypothetical protein
MQILNNSINTHKTGLTDMHKQWQPNSFSIVNMEFSECASYFAISYIQ